MREIAPQREGRIVPGAAPRRSAPAPRAGTGPSPGDGVMAVLGRLAGRMGNACLERPAETAGGFVVLCAAGYVALNALGFQDGRHPAPILPKPKPVAARQAPAAAPAKERLRSDPPAAPTPAVPPQEDSAALAKLVAETTASVTPRADKDVLQAQKALAKLGYGPVKDDGVMGPGTKAALVRFEREHKLPATGEANGRTLKALASLSSRKR